MAKRKPNKYVLGLNKAGKTAVIRGRSISMPKTKAAKKKAVSRAKKSSHTGVIPAARSAHVVRSRKKR